MATKGILSTAAIVLPDGYLELIEKLVEHAHELWLIRSIEDGWQPGPSHDVGNKQHPDLVPFAELSESALTRLREHKQETIKALIALGMELIPAAEADSTISSMKWQASVEPVYVKAQELLRKGAPLVAYNILQRCLEDHPEDMRLLQLSALSLGRIGAVRSANEIVRELYACGTRDDETLGILASTHKLLATTAPSLGEQRTHLEASFRYYLEGYEQASRAGNRDGAFYTGINAATMARLTDRMEQSNMLAAQVRRLCIDLIEEGGENYWLCATLAEAELLLGAFDRAKDAYAAATNLMDGRFGDLSSTRRQARMLLESLEKSPIEFDSLLKVPPVMIFSGHMIDAPDRPQARFPTEAEPRVATRIREHLECVKPAVVFTSAACGADIIFIEQVLKQGGEVHIVLPFPPSEFRKQSVDLVTDGNWGERFESVLSRATAITVASDHQATGSACAYYYLMLIQIGLAELHARQLETDLVSLVIWDGQPGDGMGGTSSFVGELQARDRSITQIDPLSAGASGAAEIQPAQDRNRIQHPGAPEGKFRHELKAMLFADAVGYSKLTEDQIPIFVNEFMGEIARLLDASTHLPIHKETAGDGLYFVFESVADAGLFALSLREAIKSIDWSTRGLPNNMALRIGLHCGPVFACIDPITGDQRFTGPHTSRTARIEPITPPGEVYASEAFAAISVMQDVKSLAFEFVGRTQLAKKYGAIPLYRMDSQPPK